MARKDLKKYEPATLAEAIELGRKLEKFTADPLDPADYLKNEANPEVEKFRGIISALIGTIIHIPRKVDLEKDRGVRAEAETLRAACELFEIACDHGSGKTPEAMLEIRKAIAILDAALVRFAVVAS